MLLISPLGHPVTVPTNAFPAGLLPPTGMGMKSQVPTPVRGGSVPEPVLQVTPTAKLQPDLQIVWNPVHNPDLGPATALQLQLDFAW
jgi:hypothetical protein